MTLTRVFDLSLRITLIIQVVHTAAREATRECFYQSMHPFRSRRGPTNEITMDQMVQEITSGNGGVMTADRRKHIFRVGFLEVDYALSLG